MMLELDTTPDMLGIVGLVGLVGLAFAWSCSMPSVGKIHGACAQ
jgi:hypothetical protein